MNSADKKNGRRIYWGLIGTMIVATAGVVSLAILQAGEVPGLDNLKTLSFFTSEAHAALNDDLFARSSSGDVALAELPVVPEYEDGQLVFDEVIPEEDPLDGGRLFLLPAVEEEKAQNQPVAVHPLDMTLSFLDVSRQKLADESLIEQLLIDDAEESDELPWIEHKVVQGERMVDISHKYGILVATISKANNITNPNRLTLGQVLLIPRTEDLLEDVLEEQKARAQKVAEQKKRANLVSYKKYTVKPGDSLWTIASANGLNVDSLYGTNVMRNPDRLSPGTVLRIPNQDGMTVKFAKGQTLAALAKKYEVSEKAVRMANGLDAKATPKAGDEIFLPGVMKTVAMYRGSSGGGGLSSKAPTVAKAPRVTKSFSWPVSGSISSPFGWRKHPIKKRRLFHSGLDIRAPRNTPVRAANGGQVIFAGWMSGYGRTVIVRHNSTYTTLYAHMQSIRVAKGMNVSKGTIIGRVGSSGRATGPHLHFEVRSGDRPTNPMSYLR